MKREDRRYLRRPLALSGERRWTYVCSKNIPDAGARRRNVRGQLVFQYGQKDKGHQKEYRGKGHGGRIAGRLIPPIVVMQTLGGLRETSSI